MARPKNVFLLGKQKKARFSRKHNPSLTSFKFGHVCPVDSLSSWKLVPSIFLYPQRIILITSQITFVYPSVSLALFLRVIRALTSNAYLTTRSPSSRFPANKWLLWSGNGDGIATEPSATHSRRSKTTIQCDAIWRRFRTVMEQDVNKQ